MLQSATKIYTRQALPRYGTTQPLLDLVKAQEGTYFVDGQPKVP
jgi:hypothetical protein